MPTIATYMGLIIKMYFQQAEHNPPHIHVEYAGTACAVSIKTGKVIDGRLPFKQRRIIKSWIGIHRSDLLEMWTSQNFHKIEN